MVVRRSVIVSLATVVLTLFVSSMGAYALTRFTFAGRERIAGLILMTYMFAPIMIIIPFYILVKQLGLANTRAALVLSVTALAIACWVVPMLLNERFQGGLRADLPLVEADGSRIKINPLASWSREDVAA